MASPVTLTNIDAYLEDSRAPGSAGYIPPLILQPSYGFVPSNFNGGWPEVREVTDKRPSQNGTFDFTTSFGARAVSLEVSLAPELRDDGASVTDHDLEDQLRKWMLPDVRCYLYIRFDSRDEYRRIRLRAANVSSALSFVRHRDFRKVSMSWKGVDGVFEGADLSSEELQPSTTVELGRTYDQAYDKSYAASAVIGVKPINNLGTAPTFPVITVYGPLTQARIENQTTGKKLEFLSSYSLVAGEYLVIDFKEGTVYLNGDVTNSRYDKIDFASGISEWWSLIPGVNLIRFYPLTTSAPAKAVIEWRSNYI
jgi:Siphovirus-type tail component, C-terminal domain